MLSQVCHTVWTANFSKGMKRLKPKDFMPDYEKTFETQEDRARKAVEDIRAFARGNKLIKVKKEA